MNLEDTKKILAPCGLNCMKCVAFKEGTIAKLSRDLKEALGNFEGYATRYARFYPEYQTYHAFEKLLTYLSSPQCDGCRNGHCLFQQCGVATCSKIESKEIDFCFQCDEFPCRKPEFHEDLDRRWRTRNQRMKDIGIKEYYDESKDLPRYV